MTTPSAEQLVLRPPVVVRLLAAWLAVLAFVATAVTQSIGGLVITVLLAVVASREVRISTTADETGITVRGFLSTKRLPWADVAGFATKGSSLLAVTPSNTFVLLEGADIRSVSRGERDRRLAAVLSDLNAVRPSA
jgi:hypothetical protein